MIAGTTSNEWSRFHLADDDILTVQPHQDVCAVSRGVTVQINNQGAIVDALKAGNPDMPVAHAETWARDLGGWLDEQGYVLVKLPDRHIDEDGASRWGAGATTSAASDVIEEPDGRLAIHGTPNSMNAEQALALAGALISGAISLQDQAASTQ